MGNGYSFLEPYRAGLSLLFPQLLLEFAVFSLPIPSLSFFSGLESFSDFDWSITIEKA
jgi:hypothetical protein